MVTACFGPVSRVSCLMSPVSYLHFRIPSYSPCPSSVDLLNTVGRMARRNRARGRNLLIEERMIPLELSGKVALVTGVGDNVGFAWYIAKAVNAAGARLVFACHPR